MIAVYVTVNEGAVASDHVLVTPEDMTAAGLLQRICTSIPQTWPTTREGKHINPRHICIAELRDVD